MIATADLTTPQQIAIQAIVNAVVKIKKVTRVRHGKKTQYLPVVMLKKRGTVSEAKMIESGHSIETLHELEREGWLAQWGRNGGTTWTLTPWAAWMSRKFIVEHWEYFSVARKNKAGKTRKVRVAQEIAEWRTTADWDKALKERHPSSTPRHKGECELADWVGDEEPSREPEPVQAAIAAEEHALRDAKTGRPIVSTDAVKADGRLDVDPETKRVRRVPVTLWGNPMTIDGRMGGKG